MLLTGALLFVIEPMRCAESEAFRVKLLLLGGLIVISPANSKLVSALKLALWAGRFAGVSRYRVFLDSIGRPDRRGAASQAAVSALCRHFLGGARWKRPEESGRGMLRTFATSCTRVSIAPRLTTGSG